MSVATILDRLQKVRPRGQANWTACCPAHADVHPSMTIKELDDGRVLMHCHAGCSIESIVFALGLELDALFPPCPVEHAPGLRRSFPAADVLACVAEELLIVANASSVVRQGGSLPDADHERLLVAAERILEARRLALG